LWDTWGIVGCGGLLCGGGGGGGLTEGFLTIGRLEMSDSDDYPMQQVWGSDIGD